MQTITLESINTISIFLSSHPFSVYGHCKSTFNVRKGDYLGTRYIEYIRTSCHQRLRRCFMFKTCTLTCLISFFLTSNVHDLIVAVRQTD